MNRRSTRKSVPVVTPPWLSRILDIRRVLPMMRVMNEFSAILLLLLVSLLLYRLMRSGRDSVPDVLDTPHPFHAVAIRPGRHSCAEARRLKGHRFLSSEAPLLPLAECCGVQCTCIYQHFDDRRSQLDRRDPYGLRTASWEQPDQAERRARRGRRYTDRIGHGAA